MATNDSILFERCPNGNAVPLDRNSIIIEPNDMLYLPCKSGLSVTIPPRGRWVRVVTSPVNASIGIAGLADYSLKELDGQIFHLGVFGRLQFRTAHFAGLRRFLVSKDKVSPDDFMLMLHPDIKPILSKAVTEAFGGEMPDYRRIRDEMLPLLSETINQALFAPLFSNGVCMHCGSFHIENISRPVIKRPA